MKGYKHFLDSVFYNTDINELVERHKCRATGKVRFNSQPEAAFFVHWLKWKYKKWLKKPDRNKRNNQGKTSRPRYVYHCEFCDGYHITKEHPYSYQKRTEKYQKKYFG